MPSCERCWSDSRMRDITGYGPTYQELLAERTGDKACTPEQQAGPDARVCATCGRRTIHQHVTDWCMACAATRNAVSASAPGCQRHWEERNRELVAEVQRANDGAQAMAAQYDPVHDYLQRHKVGNGGEDIFALIAEDAERLRAEVAELREALRPFAETGCAKLTDAHPDTFSTPLAGGTITVGQLRRARAALAKGGG